MAAHSRKNLERTRYTAGGKSRNWLHILGFAASVAVSVYVIIDIEFPRLGLIRVDAFDQALVELRDSMK
jgi:hypothetical protein